jgi:hypothetical protein
LFVEVFHFFLSFAKSLISLFIGCLSWFYHLVSLLIIISPGTFLLILGLFLVLLFWLLLFLTFLLVFVLFLQIGTTLLLLETPSFKFQFQFLRQIFFLKVPFNFKMFV